MNLKLPAMARRVLRAVMMFIYGVAVMSIPASAIYFLSDEMAMVVKDAVSSRTITYAIAMTTMLLAELFHDWRYQINPIRAYNKIEESGHDLAILLAGRAIAFGLVAAAIYG